MVTKNGVVYEINVLSSQMSIYTFPILICCVASPTQMMLKLHLQIPLDSLTPKPSKFGYKSHEN